MTMNWVQMYYEVQHHQQELLRTAKRCHDEEAARIRRRQRNAQQAGSVGTVAESARERELRAS